ncbi:MAG: PPE domain-containing protein [Mycobacteriaceae bacterium]|nr:PPE domain-containing protein [Mycobacteriaceae bacterium]
MAIFTPVIWEAQLPEINSTELNAGTHAISTGNAVPAWGGISAAWADVAFTCARVGAELGIGMEGINGAGAVSRIAAFFAWVDTVAAMAAGVAVANQVHSTAYTVATIAMPTAPEIAAVDAARTAAYAHGGVIDGTAEAAEAAYWLMHFRASTTMDVYEAASAPLMVVPTSFPMPPPIANELGGVLGFAGLTGNLISDGIQQAAMAAPGVLSQVGQAASGAASVGSTVMSTAASVGSDMVSSATSIAQSAGAAPLGATVPMGMGALGALGGAGAVGTVAVSFAQPGAPGGMALPPGWGSSGLSPASAGPVAAERPMVRPASNAAALGRPVQATEEEDAEHDTPEYLKNFENFADGRSVAPAVLGADPDSSR